MKNFFRIFFFIALSFIGWQVGCNAQVRPTKTSSVLFFANRTALGNYTPPASGSIVAIIRNDAASVGEETMWVYEAGVGWSQFYFYYAGGYGIDIVGNQIIKVDTSEIATHYDLSQLITHLTNGGLNVTAGENKTVKIDFDNMVDGFAGGEHLFNESDKLVFQDNSGGVLPRDIQQHYLLNGMRIEGINIIGGSGYSQTLTANENMFTIRGGGNGTATVYLDTMRNNGDVNRVVWIVNSITNDTARLIVNGRNTSHVDGVLGTFTKDTKIVLCVSVPSVGWVAYDATKTTLTAGYGVDYAGGIIKVDTGEVATPYDVSQAPNFATTNLTATGARSHNGGGFGLTFSNWLSYLLTASSGGRSLQIDGSLWQGRSDFFKFRGAVGVSHAQPVLHFYEDPDNASADNFVGLRAPATMTADLTWTLPNTDIASGSYFWTFNSSEVGSLVQYGANTGNTYAEDANYGSYQGLVNGSTGITLASGHRYIDYGGAGQGRVWTFAARPNGSNQTSNPLRVAQIPASGSLTGQNVGISFHGYRAAVLDTFEMGYFRARSTDITLASEDVAYDFYSKRNGVQTLQGTVSSLGNISFVSLNLDKTVTAAATTGAQTINKATGSVNFAAGATSLVVTNNLVTASSIIICQIATVDATMTTTAVVAGAGSFTISTPVAATAETRVNFFLTN